MTVCTRFAPSPTGYLHVGGARTALYSWLYAKRFQGQFILRIEDTDLERSTQESVDAILEGMAWLGLKADEGPYYQTKRFERYREVIQQLLASGEAYRCYCSKERLETVRQQQEESKEKPRYDRKCRELNLPHREEPYVIRFNNPVEGEVVIHDLVMGDIVFQNQELDDLVIARSDGTPTYNLTVVVDDMDMKVTHVIRGSDHINNTPRQMNMLKALKASLPAYAHIPMILGSDGKRLSKRHGAVSVLQFREEGFLPEALLNYLVRLGWSHGDEEIFSMKRLCELFDLKAVHRSAATFDMEKLLWVNQQYLKTMATEDLIPHLEWHFQQLHLDRKEGPSLEAVIEALRERVKTLKEMAEKASVFYKPLTTYHEEAVKQFFKEDVLNPLKDILERLRGLKTWGVSEIHGCIQETLGAHQLKMPALAQPLRVALTGNTTSPSIDVTLYLAGQEKALARIEKAIDMIQGK